MHVLRRPVEPAGLSGHWPKQPKSFGTVHHSNSPLLLDAAMRPVIAAIRAERSILSA